MTDNTRTVRIVVLGDAGVGKTSLVMSLLLEKFPKDEESLAVLPEVAIPSKYNPDNVNVFIVDTPADIESLGERPIHAIILVYDVQSPESFHRLKSHWLPWLVKKGHNVPVILAGNKIDLRGADMDNPKLVDQTVPLMAEFRCIETCIECSAKQMINVSEVFYFAQKSVIHPSAPLYDAEENVVRDECLAAMQRIFRHCDLDGDGFLSDMELDYFQRRCFNKPLQKTDIAGIKETITEAFPEGVTPQGITEAGFMHMNKMFIQRGRLDTFWGILRAFGYNDELKMELPQIGLDGDSTLEITSYGTKLLSDLFKRFSLDQEFISPGQLNDLFRLTVDGRNPWLPHFPKSAVHSENGINHIILMVIGDLPLDSFLAQWMLFAYELPFEATAVFTELIGLGEVPKSFKVVPFEEINQRRVFKIALLSTVQHSLLIFCLHRKAMVRL